MRLGPLPRIMTFLRSVGRRFVLRFVARIQIRREAFEFRRAGIHAIEHRRDAEFFAARAHGHSHRRPATGPSVVSEIPSRLASTELIPWKAYPELLPATSSCSKSIDFAHLLQEPRIDGSDLVNLLHRPALLKREADIAQPLGSRRDQLWRISSGSNVSAARGLAGFETAHGLCPAPV